MNGRRASARARERKWNRILMGAFVLVLLAGLIAQGVMMKRLSDQDRQCASLQKQTYELSLAAENLNHSLAQYHDRDRIAAKAAQLGMEQPDDSQIRVVSLPARFDGTTAQSAENVDAQAAMD